MTDDRRAVSRRITPPIYLIIAAALMIALHVYVPATQLIEYPWRWLGTASMAAGFGFVLWARAVFQRAGTAARPFTAPKALVVAGPYSLSRNPMYVGLVAMLAGLAVGLGSVTPWLVIPLFIWRIQADVIAAEERLIESAFGGAYLEYKSHVRRWL